MTKSTRIAKISRGSEEVLNSKLKSWKNKYAGERCFCVGNGPSLRDTPLDLIKNEFSFGLNRIAKIYPSTSWRPTFYVNVTIGITDSGWAKDARVASENTPSFVGLGALPYILDSDGWGMTVPENIFPLLDVYTEKVWGYEITNGLSKHGSSMLAVMQIAMYMGFNPIYLVGCDCEWVSFDYEADKDPNHFVDTYWGKLKLNDKEPIHVTPDVAEYYTRCSIECHTLAKAACDNRGVAVYNATVGGSLDVYPRVNLEEVLKCTASY